LRFDVSPSSAVKLMRRVRATGSAKPAKYGGYRRPLLEPYEAELRTMVEATPDITLAEVRRRFAERGVSVGITAIHTTLRRLGLRHKKSR
jgi:transposase